LDGHQILAVVVPESRNSPHFAGPAYVRKGGKSPKVCDKMLDELVSDRLSKVRELRKWLEQPVSLAAVQQPNPMQRNIQPRKEIILTEVTPHWIAWKRTSDGSFHSIPLEEIKLQKDDRGSGRLLILIPHVDWVER
jgi:hypothetical protein